MTLQELLKEDKERFLQQCAKAQNSLDVVSDVEDELNRILNQYNDQEKDEEIQKEAQNSIAGIHAATAFLDCMGEPEIYSQQKFSKKKKQKSKFFKPTLICAFTLMILGFAFLLFCDSDLFQNQNTFIGVIVLIIGALLFYIAGKKSIATVSEDSSLFAQVKPDGEKVYHVLYAAVSAIDQKLNYMKNQSVLQHSLKMLDHEDLIDPKLLDLLLQLLENAYSTSENEVSQAFISEISFYLHQNNIEVVNYSNEHNAWFEKMPGKVTKTLRPALICNGIVYKKGLVSGGE